MRLRIGGKWFIRNHPITSILTRGLGKQRRGVSGGKEEGRETGGDG